jgi:hypothetical protein
MKTTEHFAFAALLVLGTAAPAMAVSPLYPVGDEPNASGKVWGQRLRHPAVIPPTAIITSKCPAAI